MRGRNAEDRALAFLKARGLRPVARNWRARTGELDLVMEDRGTLVIVEVRARRSDRFGSAAESVGPRKQGRLIRTAQAFLQARGRSEPVRFDVVAISGSTPERVQWITNAFEVNE
ncbi:MAG: YraN family protein [Gammaproteobacteria bacterium]|jgi:putative endonuclease